MVDLDLDAIEARARTTYPSSDAAPLMRDVPMLVREVRRLTAALAEAEADALAQRSIATREAQERRDHQDRADRQTAALREVEALFREAQSLVSKYTRGPGENGDRVADLLTDDAYRIGADGLAILARHSGGEG